MLYLDIVCLNPCRPYVSQLNEPNREISFNSLQRKTCVQTHNVTTKAERIGVSIIQHPFHPASNNHHFSQQFDFLPCSDLYIVTMATARLGIVSPAAPMSFTQYISISNFMGSLLLCRFIALLCLLVGSGYCCYCCWFLF